MLLPFPRPPSRPRAPAPPPAQMLATLAADPIAGLIDTAYLGHLSSADLAGAGVALSIFNLAIKLLAVPLLFITTTSVATALGRSTADGGASSGGPAEQAARHGGADGDGDHELLLAGVRRSSSDSGSKCSDKTKEAELAGVPFQLPLPALLALPPPPPPRFLPAWMMRMMTACTRWRAAAVEVVPPAAALSVTSSIVLAACIGLLQVRA